jgi:hypothetical protein
MNGFFPNGNGNRALFLYQLKWLAAFMTVGFGIVYLFTFPVDLVMLIALFLLINIYRRRTMLKKLGVFEDSRAKGIRGFFKSFFQSSTSSSMYGNNNTPLKYYCMSCGNEHKETACPKCGSKMKKVG